MKKLLLLFAFGLPTAFADTFIAKPALHEGVTGVTVTGVTTQLTVLSETVQHLMGATTQIVALPNATTLKPGRYWVVRNDSSQSATVRYFGGGALSTVRPATSLVARLKSAVTSDGDWTLETQDFIRTAGDTMSGSLGLDYATADRAAYVDGAKVVRTSTTVSSQELEYLDGVTSNLGARVNNFTDAEGARLAGVTSGIQSQIDNAFSVISGKVNRSADTMTGSFGLSYANVTPDRAAYVDDSRIVRTSTSVSSQELEYLDGVTANIQAQIAAAGGGGGSFVSKTGDTMTGGLTALAGVTSTGIVKVISGANGGLSVVSDTSSAGAFLQRTGSATGSMYLGVAGDRNGSNTYDEFQVRQGTDTQVSFALRDTDAGVQTLYWGASTDAFIQRSGSGAFTTPATFTTTASSGNAIVSGASIKANQDILIGQAGAGTGGKVRIFCDTGGVECWRIGPAGSTGAWDLDFRSQIAGAVAMSISTAGIVTHKRGVADESLSVQTPAVSSSYTIGNNVSTFILAPSSNLTTSTVIMPANPANFQLLTVSCTGNGIGTLTHLASGAHTLENPLTTCSNGLGAQWIFQNSGSGFWRRKAGFTPPTSEVFVRTANGYGSTATKIRRWTTTDVNTGTDISYSDSATLGGQFVINNAGVYAIHYCDNFNAAANMGISVNSGQTTTSVQSITGSDVACGNVSAAVDIGVCCSTVMSLPILATVRAHTDATASGSNTWMQSFRIKKISP